MEETNIAEYLDQHRWLLNNGLVTDAVKNQLFFCGSIVHRDVQAVELDLNPEQKLVNYKIYMEKSMLKKMKLYKELSTSTSLFGMWRFKRLLNKEGSLDFQAILSKFVADFCGPKWTVKVEVIDFDQYVDELGVEGEDDKGSQRPDKLPD